jgi:hypothetical protein
MSPEGRMRLRDRVASIWLIEKVCGHCRYLLVIGAIFVCTVVLSALSGHKANAVTGSRHGYSLQLSAKLCEMQFSIRKDITIRYPSPKEALFGGHDRGVWICREEGFWFTDWASIPTFFRANVGYGKTGIYCMTREDFFYWLLGQYRMSKMLDNSGCRSRPGVLPGPPYSPPPLVAGREMYNNLRCLKFIEGYECPLDRLQSIATNLVGVDHGSQLEKVYCGDSECNDQSIQSDIKRVGFIELAPLHWIWHLLCNLLNVLFWLALCWVFANLNVGYAGGRSNALFILTLVFLAMSAAHLVVSLLKLLATTVAVLDSIL